MIRAFNDGGGAIGSTAIGSAHAAGSSWSTSSRQAGQPARWSSNAARSTSSSAPST
jgi:hypothetical protein